MSKKILLLVSLGVLILALVAQGVAFLTPEKQPRVTKPLKDYLPLEHVGWYVEELPLGNTETLDEASRAILNFDDYAHYSFTRAGSDFSVYIAYWKPGKMPVRLVNSHTPDRCWTWTGWQCTDMKFQQPASSSAGDLQPLEWRVFEKNSNRIYVNYWHIVGGKVHVYREGFNEMPPITVVFDDLLTYGLNLKREQFFVRISSSKPLEQVWNEEAFQEVLTALRALCLAPPEELPAAL